VQGETKPATPDPRPPLSATTADRVDEDQAAYLLGVSLGAFTARVPFSGSKWLLWSDGPVARGLHAALLALVEAGVLESRDDDQFRWAAPGFLNAAPAAEEDRTP
jgi:hypothetical protein